MRAIHVLVAALLGASAGAILVVFLWVFCLQQVGLAPALFPWVMLAGAIGGGSFGAGTTWHSLAAYQRRLRGNREFATKLQLRFEEKPADGNWPLSFVGQVQSGENCTWKFLWQGVYDGLPLEVVDVEYRVRSPSTDGQDEYRTYEHTVYAWNVEPIPLPEVSIVGRNWGVAVTISLFGNGRVLGFQTVNLSEHHAAVVREFNRHFVVVASKHADEEDSARKFCVPHVMQAMLQLGRVRLDVARGRITIFWPQTISSGEDRQKRIEQTQRLIQALISAMEDRSTELVPADPRVNIEAAWSLMPLGCAIGLGMFGFLTGGIAAAIIGFLLRKQGGLPQHLFPSLPLGALVLFGFLGWGVGYVLNRLRTW